MPTTKRKPSRKAATAVAAPPSKPARKPSQKWQLQMAKAKFSEVFRLARTVGPQHVVKHGKEEVVVISKEAFEKLNPSPEKENLWDFFRNSPLTGSGIDLERRRDYPRKIEL